MILGNPADPAAPPQPKRVAIDEVLRRAAARRPDAIALADPPNRTEFTDGAPRKLTYREADRIVSAIAARLRSMGLQTDAVVGIQLPNTVECVLTILGVLRAGMIAALLPQLWRKSETVAALTPVDVKALITCRRIGASDHCNLAMQAAADVFSVRYVCAFGSNLPDGVVPLDPVFDDNAPVDAQSNVDGRAAHVAVLTWDVVGNGLVPVARSHTELIAGGTAVLLESAIAMGTSVLSTCPPTSFGGISMTLLPWLMSGATLHLHHPLDPDVLDAQRRELRCGVMVLPAALAFALADAGRLDARDGLRTVIAHWRSPERLASSPRWRDNAVALLDVPVFGEMGLIAARRGGDGRPAPINAGPVKSPRGPGAGISVVALSRTPAGTLALRGPMTPRHPFPSGPETAWPGSPWRPEGVIDTGFACRGSPDSPALHITAPPAGIVSLGGCRYAMRDLQEALTAIEDGAVVVGLPDALLGQRLAISTADADTLRAALNHHGHGPLVVGALRDRRVGQAHAA